MLLDHPLLPPLPPLLLLLLLVLLLLLARRVLLQAQAQVQGRLQRIGKSAYARACALCAWSQPREKSGSPRTACHCRAHALLPLPLRGPLLLLVRSRSRRLLLRCLPWHTPQRGPRRGRPLHAASRAT